MPEIANGGVLKKVVLKNTHKKTPVLESLFNKVVPTQVFPRKYCKFFKDTYFEEHLRTAASECRPQQQ